MIGNLIYVISALVGFQFFSDGAPKPLALTLVGTFLFLVITALAGYLRVKRMIARLKKAYPPGHPAAMHVFNSWKTAYQLLIMLVYMGMLMFWGWGTMVNDVMGLRQAVLIDELLGLAPYLLMLAMYWSFAWIFQNAIAKDKWGYWDYIKFNASLTLTPVLPLVFFILIADLIYLIPYPYNLWLGSGGIVDYLMMLGFFALIGILFPLILIKAWGCKPLEPGPTRFLLESVCRDRGLKYNDIVIWNIGAGKFINAGVLGLVAPFRYIMFTRRILEVLTEEELVAVLGHEIGHAKRHHMLLNLLISFGFLSFLMVAVQMISAAIGGINAELARLLEFALTIGAVVLYWRVIFGFLSRRFEREADIYGMETAGGTGPMIASLEKLAVVSGRPRQLPDWTHYSIAQRVEFLEDVERNPVLARDFQKESKRFKGWMAGTAAAFLLLFLLAAMQMDSEPPLDSWFAAKRYEMIEAYLQDELADPELEPLHEASLRNNLAWLYATADDALFRHPADALQNAELAVDILKQAIENGSLPAYDAYVQGALAAYLDTLAAAWYAAGDNQKAYQISRMALDTCPPEDPSFQTIYEAVEKYRQAILYNDRYI